MSPLPSIYNVWHSCSTKKIQCFQHIRNNDMITMDPIHLSRIDLPLCRSYSPCRSPNEVKVSCRSPLVLSRSVSSGRICNSANLHRLKTTKRSSRYSQIPSVLPREKNPHALRRSLGATSSEKSALIENHLEYFNSCGFLGKILR